MSYQLDTICFYTIGGLIPVAMDCCKHVTIRIVWFGKQRHDPIGAMRQKLFTQHFFLFMLFTRLKTIGIYSLFLIHVPVLSLNLAATTYL